MSTLIKLGLTPTMIYIFLITMVLSLIITSAFILLGMTAFVTGGAFGFLINTSIPVLTTGFTSGVK